MSLIVAAVLLGTAVILQSWPIAVAGIVFGLCGSVAAVRSHILAQVSLGQSPYGP